MHVDALGQDRGDVHAPRVALQHAVRDEHQPVSYLQLQRLHPVAASGLQAKRAVGLVVGLARSDASAAALATPGAELGMWGFD
jgi:hypothetical protein